MVVFIRRVLNVDGNNNSIVFASQVNIGGVFFLACAQNALKHWPALVSALTHSLVDFEDELQLFVGAEGGERAVHSLTRLTGLPVILPLLVHLVTAWRLLIVVPSSRTFFYTHTHRAFNSLLLYLTASHRNVYHLGCVRTLFYTIPLA